MRAAEFMVRELDSTTSAMTRCRDVEAARSQERSGSTARVEEAVERDVVVMWTVDVVVHHSVVIACRGCKGSAGSLDRFGRMWLSS